MSINLLAGSFLSTDARAASIVNAIKNLSPKHNERVQKAKYALLAKKTELPLYEEKFNEFVRKDKIPSDQEVAAILNLKYDANITKANISSEIRRPEKDKKAVIDLYIKEVQNSINQKNRLQPSVSTDSLAAALKDLKSPAQREVDKVTKESQSNRFLPLVPIDPSIKSLNSLFQELHYKPLLKEAPNQGKEIDNLLQKVQKDGKPLSIIDKIQIVQTIEKNGWYYNPEDIMNIPINPDPNYQVPVNINPTIGYKSVFSADNTYTLRYFDCKNNKVQELDLTSKLLEFGKTFELQGIKKFQGENLTLEELQKKEKEIVLTEYIKDTVLGSVDLRHEVQNIINGDNDFIKYYDHIADPSEEKTLYTKYLTPQEVKDIKNGRGMVLAYEEKSSKIENNVTKPIYEKYQKLKQDILESKEINHESKQLEDLVRDFKESKFDKDIFESKFNDVASTLIAEESEELILKQYGQSSEHLVKNPFNGNKFVPYPEYESDVIKAAKKRAVDAHIIDREKEGMKDGIRIKITSKNNNSSEIIKTDQFESVTTEGVIRDLTPHKIDVSKVIIPNYKKQDPEELKVQITTLQQKVKDLETENTMLRNGGQISYSSSPAPTPPPLPISVDGKLVNPNFYANSTVMSDKSNVSSNEVKSPASSGYASEMNEPETETGKAKIGRVESNASSGYASGTDEPASQEAEELKETESLEYMVSMFEDAEVEAKRQEEDRKETELLEDVVSMFESEEAEAKRQEEEQRGQQKDQECQDQENHTQNDNEDYKSEIKAEVEEVNQANDAIIDSEPLREQEGLQTKEQVQSDTNSIVALLHNINLKSKDLPHNIFKNRIAVLAAGDEDKAVTRGVWISGLYGTSSQGAWKNVPKYQGRTAGVTIGADTGFSDSSDIIGIAYSRIESHFKYNKKIGKTSLNGHLISAYGLKELPKNFSLQGIVSFGHNYIKNKTKNANNIVGKYQNNNFNFENLLSYKHRTKNDTYLIPSIGLKYNYSRNSDYKEYGNIQNLTIQKKSNQSLDGVLGGKIIFKPRGILKNITLTPSLHGNVEKSLYNKNTKFSTKATFNDKVIEETITLPKAPKVGYNLGGNILINRKNIDMLLEYNYYIHKKYQAHQGMLKLKVNL
ncbi:MAG TPA: autotransporter domain-containing protein [Rickettsia endosymbiont of Pyrocoelia pectoralis]|nr:autotransporter domain-containing protein [Rickettsia endosymbiont of Pyrocoelia pectoralis]